MMPWQVTSLEKFERREPLKNVVADRFRECVRSHGPEWSMPAMEATANFDVFGRLRSVSVRIFDMKGDGEVQDPSPALGQGLEDLHAFCASHGENWRSVLLTLIPSPDPKTEKSQWNYSYTH